MINHKQAVLKAFDDLDASLKILIHALQKNDGDAAHEAVTVLLHQSIMAFGVDSPIMRQFFPVFERIKQHIDALTLTDALGQTELFKGQIVQIVSSFRGG